MEIVSDCLKKGDEWHTAGENGYSEFKGIRENAGLFKTDDALLFFGLVCFYLGKYLQDGFRTQCHDDALLCFRIGAFVSW